MERRCKLLEEKSDKLKSFKRLIKSCSALTCISCGKNYVVSNFESHVDTCKSKSYSEKADIDQICQISINQTMVKESPDCKPFTEYVIQVVCGEEKWTVCRKYRDFCDLYQKINTQFEGEFFSEAASRIFYSAIDGTYNQQKKPTLIEDRRKALQQFLRDILNFTKVKESDLFKKFIGFLSEGDKKNIQSRQKEWENLVNCDAFQKLKLEGSNFLQPDEAYPQSPSSFLKNWNGGKGNKSIIQANGLKRTPMSKSVLENLDTSSHYLSNSQLDIESGKKGGITPNTSGKNSIFDRMPFLKKAQVARNGIEKSRMFYNQSVVSPSRSKVKENTITSQSTSNFK